MMDRCDWAEFVKENIDYNGLCERHQIEALDGLANIMIDTICATTPTVRVGGSEVPISAVRARLLSLDFSHIEYVLECIQQTSGDIPNIRAYLLTSLYNAPTTIDRYYDNAVRRDFS